MTTKNPERLTLTLTLKATAKALDELHCVTVDLDGESDSPEDQHRRVFDEHSTFLRSRLKLTDCPAATVEWLRGELQYFGDPGSGWDPELAWRCRSFQRLAAELLDALDAEAVESTVESLRLQLGGTRIMPKSPVCIWDGTPSGAVFDVLSYDADANIGVAQGQFTKNLSAFSLNGKALPRACRRFLPELKVLRWEIETIAIGDRIDADLGDQIPGRWITPAIGF